MVLELQTKTDLVKPTARGLARGWAFVMEGRDRVNRNRVRVRAWRGGADCRWSVRKAPHVPYGRSLRPRAQRLQRIEAREHTRLRHSERRKSLAHYQQAPIAFACENAEP